MKPQLSIAIVCGVTILSLLYGHEKGEAERAARQAFEVQRDKNKSDAQVAWQQGFICGANSGIDSMGQAMMKGAELGTNAIPWVQSNVVWVFNLARPK